MASDSQPAGTPVTRLVQGSPAPIKSNIAETGGKPLPVGGNAAPVAAAASAAQPLQAQGPEASPASAPVVTAPVVHARTPAPPRDLQTMVGQLNKYLNDSGRPNQYRVDTTGGTRVIQEINPANGKVIGQFAAEEFPALARSLGVSGILVNGIA